MLTERCNKIIIKIKFWYCLLLLLLQTSFSSFWTKMWEKMSHLETSYNTHARCFVLVRCPHPLRCPVGAVWFSVFGRGVTQSVSIKIIPEIMCLKVAINTFFSRCGFRTRQRRERGCLYWRCFFFFFPFLSFFLFFSPLRASVTTHRIQRFQMPLMEHNVEAASRTGVETQDSNLTPPESNRVALAFSGGGIRSASFCSGVLSSIPIEKVSKVSCVSGGGYLGSALVDWLVHCTSTRKKKKGKKIYIYSEKEMKWCVLVDLTWKMVGKF